MESTMHITEEDKTSFEIECRCGSHFHALKTWGVVHCHHCGRDQDPRRLQHKWARSNDPDSPMVCMAL